MGETRNAGWKAGEWRSVKEKQRNVQLYMVRQILAELWLVQARWSCSLPVIVGEGGEKVERASLSICLFLPAPPQ